MAEAERVLGGRYRLVRRIGEGGMGEVWEAENVSIGRRVAVKLLTARLASSAEAVARFQREARVAGGLGHDNICPVLDAGTEPDGGQYLVMELLRGRTLAEELRARPVLEPARALDIVAQVLSALAAAHAAGVVHRDLKPDNVFLTRFGGRDDFVRVLDFGIAKVIRDDLALSRLTQTGSLLGTPWYMAPEQAYGSKDQDARVDVYAAGVMLYEAVTGRRPHEAENINQLIIKVATASFPSPRSVQPSVPVEVEEVILRAMSRERDARYPSAEAMHHAVLAARDVVVQRGPSGTVPGVGTEPRELGQVPVGTSGPVAGRRARAPWVLAAGLALLAAVGGAAAVFQPGAKPGAEPSPLRIPGAPAVSLPVPSAQPRRSSFAASATQQALTAAPDGAPSSPGLPVAETPQPPPGFPVEHQPLRSEPAEVGTTRASTLGRGARQPESQARAATPASRADTDREVARRSDDSAAARAQLRLQTDVSAQPVQLDRPPLQAHADDAAASQREVLPAQPTRQDVSTAMASVSPAVRACGGGNTGTAQILTTFASSGRVTTAIVIGWPFANTPAGSCMERAVKGARVPPFTGPSLTVTFPFVVRDPVVAPVVDSPVPQMTDPEALPAVTGRRRSSRR